MSRDLKLGLFANSVNIMQIVEDKSFLYPCPKCFGFTKICPYKYVAYVYKKLCKVSNTSHRKNKAVHKAETSMSAKEKSFRISLCNSKSSLHDVKCYFHCVLSIVVKS